MQLWIPLAGALIGGLMALLGTVVAHRLGRGERREERRRSEVLPIASRLLAESETVFNRNETTLRLSFSLMMMQQRLSKEPQLTDTIQDVERRLQAGIAECNSANQSARLAVAELAIICPSLEPSAHALLDASHPPTPGHPRPVVEPAHIEAWRSARGAFIEAVRDDLADKTRVSVAGQHSAPTVSGDSV
ncbi:hypothetical protein [Enemella evansiae]|uniref:hypothetical protein n=1 Tax=Enemella evansiae TaxID=2016499 RepID=UPI00117EEAEB|nr:hypothetical protein [Enemella evansiae]